MTVETKLEWLDRAQAMQRIEDNPLTPDEIAQFEAWEAQGLTSDQMRERILADIADRNGPAVAAE